ncbi:MAG: hypothetical protein FWE16_03395 [Firmicutes bacterium]|nr:hypothetical protein [Bacillota bacterium]
MSQFVIRVPKLKVPSAMHFDKRHVYGKRPLLSVAGEGIQNFFKKEKPEPVDIAEDWEVDRPLRFDLKKGLAYPHANGRYEYVETRQSHPADAESFIGDGR